MSSGSSSAPDDDLREHALACFEAGLAAVEPRAIVTKALRADPPVAAGRIVVAAIGKAARAMAEGAFDVLDDRVSAGVIIAPGEISDAPTGVRAYRGGHPIPNAEGLAGARDLLDLARGLDDGDLLLTLISGGGSALTTLPPDGVGLEDLQEATGQMLRAGAEIGDLNALRKHLDQLKGGRLARAAAPAELRALVLSDVVGDPLDTIASGPATPDPTTFAEVLAALDRLGVRSTLPSAVLAYLEGGVRGEVAESPKPGDPCFERAAVSVVGSNRMAAAAALAEAERRGFEARLLSTELTGEAREVGAELGDRARQIRDGRAGDRRPACLVAAGETTVTVHGSGLGGRNQELALGAVSSLDGLEGVLVASLGTDGIDGPTDAAGAWALGDTAARAREAGLDPADYLARNDSYRFFERLGDLVVTGPTGTNVMDLQLVFVS